MDRREAELYRCDLRSGIIASVIANVNRDRNKQPQPFIPEDFMPVTSRTENAVAKKPTPDEIAAKWDMIKHIHNARIGHGN